MSRDIKHSYKNFDYQLNLIRVGITKFLLSLFIFLFSIALVFYLFNLLFLTKNFNYVEVWLFFAITICGLVAFTAMRLKIGLQNYKFFLITILTFLTLNTIVIAFTTGTFTTIIYPIIITCVLVIAVVFNTRSAVIYTTSLFLTFVIVSILQLQGSLKYTPDWSSSDIEDVFIAFVFVWIVLNIARIGYQQISDSYNKAADYSLELEKLNKELDERVKERTQKLNDNYQQQIDSMYSSAVIGNIAKPMLHDIATPVSAIKGVVDLAKRKKKYDPELFEVAETAAAQMEKMISDSRDLMQSQLVTDVFNIDDAITAVSKMLRSEMYRYKIDFTFKPDKDHQIYIQANKGLFERVIMNLLVNALEELKNKPNNRRLKIETSETDQTITIAIRDNGRGIPPEYINSIFEEEFSLKHDDYNLGLGLPFVKKTIENKFKGSIKVESEINKYTQLTLILPLYENLKPGD